MKEIILDQGRMYKDNLVEQGTCPKCNGTDLDYTILEIEGNLLYYPWTCNDCGTKGKEWYSLEFTGHNIYE
jgi:C4-type Zn-finger protein